MQFTLPTLPLGGEHATVVRWLAEPGAALTLGQPLLIVRTERAEIVLPATADGTLGTVLAAEEQTIAIGAALAEIETAAAASTASQSAHLSPVARRVAHIHQLDPAALVGTGPGGRILKRDVLALLHDQPQQIAQSEAVQPALQPQAPSLKPQASSPTLRPLVLTAMAVDFSSVEAWCRQARRAAGLRVDSQACAVQAAAQTLLAHPLCNSTWNHDSIVARRRVHIAVDNTVVRDAQDLNVRGIARSLTNVANAADTPTFDLAFGQSIWSHLEPSGTAALHISPIEQQAVVIADANGERLATRPIALLALRYDARAIGQHQADAFLRDLRHAIEHFTP